MVVVQLVAVQLVAVPLVFLPQPVATQRCKKLLQSLHSFTLFLVKPLPWTLSAFTKLNMLHLSKTSKSRYICNNRDNLNQVQPEVTCSGPVLVNCYLFQPRITI